MSTPSQSRRFTCALLALPATFALHGTWLGDLDHSLAASPVALTA